MATQANTCAEEIWKPVPNTGGRYRVSNLGRVIGPSGRVLKPRLNGGYHRIAISMGATYHKSVMVHRLVAAAFCQQRPGCNQVNHKDVNRGNNRADNLEWVTCSENHAHREKFGTSFKGEKNPNAKLTEAEVRLIRVRLELGQKHKDIAEAFLVSKSLISCIARNENWK